jgi:hypothetical protein
VCGCKEILSSNILLRERGKLLISLRFNLLGEVPNLLIYIRNIVPTVPPPVMFFLKFVGDDYPYLYCDPFTPLPLIWGRFELNILERLLSRVISTSRRNTLIL